MKPVLRLVLVLILSCLCASVFAQAYNSDTLEVYFRQGKHTWDPTYRDNGQRLQGFVDRFKKLREDRVMSKISKIHIISGASPEGSWAFNQRLSTNRAKRIQGVLKEYIDLPDSVVVVDSRGVNWQGLRELVVADSAMPHRQEVLDIIDNSPELDKDANGRTRELRKVRLMWRFDGKAWRYMYERFFPILRIFKLQIVVEWERFEAAKQEVEREDRIVERIAIPPMSLPEPVYPIPTPTPIINKPLPSFYMAIRNNLLYDALLVPNIGVEFYLGNRYAVVGNWMYAWWKSDPSSWYHRTYGGDLEVRRYFGRKAHEKPLQGWHVGLYGQTITYDFEWGGRGYLGDRWSYAGGVAFGYSLPVRHRLNLDFTLGVGYLGGEYKEYLPIDDCYVWQVTKQRRWFGPTKLEASLVWLIGRGNVNEGKKGGRR